MHKYICFFFDFLHLQKATEGPSGAKLWEMYPFGVLLGVLPRVLLGSFWKSCSPSIYLTRTGYQGSLLVLWEDSFGCWVTWSIWSCCCCFSTGNLLWEVFGGRTVPDGAVGIYFTSIYDSSCWLPLCGILLVKSWQTYVISKNIHLPKGVWDNTSYSLLILKFLWIHFQNLVAHCKWKHPTASL